LGKARINGEKRAFSLTANVMGIFLIDIDHFKEVNDTYGHTAGDNVLVSIARILKSAIRSDDFIVRWGGEEFLIILNNSNPEYLERFAKKILHTVNHSPLKLFNDKTISKTCSLGFAQLPFNREMPDFLTLEQSILLVDFALYTAKETGRNRAVFLKIRENAPCDEKMKKDLITISKDSPIDDKYFELITFFAEGE
jgi:diguanylate cyclase (GGDEF)-like protein